MNGMNTLRAPLVLLASYIYNFLSRENPKSQVSLIFSKSSSCVLALRFLHLQSLQPSTTYCIYTQGSIRQSSGP